MRILGTDDGKLYTERLEEDSPVYTRTVLLVGQQPYKITLGGPSVPFQFEYSDSNTNSSRCLQFNGFDAGSCLEASVGNDRLPNGVRNVWTDRLRILFQVDEDSLSHVNQDLTVLDARGARVSTNIFSSELETREVRRSTGASKYGVNLKSIISASFSVVFPSSVQQRTTISTANSNELYYTVQAALNEYFQMRPVQQIQIIDVRETAGLTVIDCTLAIFMNYVTNSSDNFLARFNRSDLIEWISLSTAESEVSLTPFVHVIQTDRAFIPFVVIVTFCSTLIVTALVVFLKIGISKGKPKGEIISGWFLSVFRPTVLVIAETLIWRKYVEQYQIIYPSYKSLGAGFIIIVLFGFGCSLFKTTAFIYRIYKESKWSFPWSPGNLPTIIGIMTHDLPVTFLVYFYYTKYFSVLSSFQLTIMVFQAAHLTLILKQVKEQRQTNKDLREKKMFWIGNFFTAFFFFFSLVTITLMFARTVALQVGKMSILSGKHATHSTMKYFTPDYRRLENVIGRNCMTTLEGPDGFYNSPTPFESSCLNSVEYAMIVMFGLCYSGIFLLFFYVYKYCTTKNEAKYVQKPIKLSEADSRDDTTA